MIPRLHISFSIKNQFAYWLKSSYSPKKGEYLFNHARSGILMALKVALPNSGRVGLVAYNCHTVANAIVQAGCTPVFIDVTEDLRLNVQSLYRLKLDALVLTNLFGIRNDIDTIRSIIGHIPLIVDNAHGFGLPPEGDFTVYSINQGKFPALGEGGVLYVNNPIYIKQIDMQYAKLKDYSILEELKLFITMLLKAVMHRPLIYLLLTHPVKQKRKKVLYRENIVIHRMAKGVSRMYKNVLPLIKNMILDQKYNAQNTIEHLTQKQMIQRAWYGENAFMLIVECPNPSELQLYMARNGVETATHFVKALDWAKEFGYVNGECPMTELLTQKLLMIPTYRKINI